MKDEDRLIATYIEPHPNRPGADEVRIKGYGMSVWALIGDYLANGRDTSAVVKGYCVPQEVVEAALAYYRRHREVIDNRLSVNAA